MDNLHQHCWHVKRSTVTSKVLTREMFCCFCPIEKTLVLEHSQPFIPDDRTHGTYAKGIKKYG